MSTREEFELRRQGRPGGSGIWAPVVPEPREPQEWVVQADDEPVIVRSVD
ncbi:hypothetical protein SAMN04488074_11587 [Lentzea albidocapillata subsp. violacea]|uniref:Uncharacterized protein n=1 Tax=Lentzea albidocapillata subsp. violacea TaxID=128104 RepID=A0A1G9PM66_9PSEU|nr:hypothetical protein [Lentzea albidocapillata]SDL99185.1 hypothetical protein SAMN04488074_11587 [Lentzea albidocapillata subsp. violacea]